MMTFLTYFVAFFFMIFTIMWAVHNEEDDWFAPKFFDVNAAVETAAIVSLVLTSVIALIKIIIGLV